MFKANELEQCKFRIDQLIAFYSPEQVIDCWTNGNSSFQGDSFLLVHLKNLVRTYGISYVKVALIASGFYSKVG